MSEPALQIPNDHLNRRLLRKAVGGSNPLLSLLEVLCTDSIYSFKDDFDEDTATKLRELWGHLARIGLVSLHLQGRILINQDRILASSLPVEERPEPKTFGDLLADNYREAVAGLNASDQPEQVETETHREEVTA